MSLQPRLLKVYFVYGFLNVFLYLRSPSFVRENNILIVSSCGIPESFDSSIVVLN